MPSFFFRKLQLITVLLLICDSYISWSTRLVSLIIDMSQKFPLKFRLFCYLILILQLCLFRTYSILLINLRRKFTLVARYSLRFTRCSLLVVKSLNAHYSLRNSLVTCCRSFSLQKITRYSLQKLFLVKNHSLLVAKFDR